MSDPVTSVPDSETDEDSDSDVDMGCSTANEAANEDPYSTQALEEHERRLYQETPATQLDPRPEQPNNRDRNNDDSVMPHNTSGGTGDTMFLYTVLMVHVCQFVLHFEGEGADRKSCLHLLCFQTVNLAKGSSSKKSIVRLHRSW